MCHLNFGVDFNVKRERTTPSCPFLLTPSIELSIELSTPLHFSSPALVGFFVPSDSTEAQHAVLVSQRDGPQRWRPLRRQETPRPRETEDMSARRAAETTGDSRAERDATYFSG